MSEYRILLVGGGSGGHVYPLVAVAQALREKAAGTNVNLRLMMLGEGDFLKRAAEENRIPFQKISAGKLRRYASFKTAFDLIKIPLSFFQSFWHLFLFMPDAVFAKGGYASVAPVIIAKLFFIPTYIHESDSVPGLANVMLGKIVNKVFISFKTAEKFFQSTEVVFTGNPVRKVLGGGDKNKAREFFNLPENRKTILVLGGSQGAKAINDTILSSLVVLTEKFQVIHQCGDNNYNMVKQDADVIIKEGVEKYADPINKYYRLYPFLDSGQLASAYALSDLIISRAGSGALFEIALLGKPAIIVPIPQSPGNHQYLNAFEFSLSGGALIEEYNLNRDSLYHEIESLLHEETYAIVAQKIKNFSAPGAADKIAEELLKK